MHSRPKAMTCRKVPELKSRSKCIVTGLAFRIGDMDRAANYQRIVRVPDGHGRIIPEEHENLQKVNVAVRCHSSSFQGRGGSSRDNGHMDRHCV